MKVLSSLIVRVLQRWELRGAIYCTLPQSLISSGFGSLSYDFANRKIWFSYG